MKWNFGILAWGLLGLAAASQPAIAADHKDGAEIRKDPSTDINDVFAWTAPDGKQIYLVMTVFPQAAKTSQFSPAAQYVFNITSQAKYGDPAAASTKIMCTFDSSQTIRCWLGTPGAAPTEFVTGNASATAGIASSSGKLKVFAGPRNDPFFFNLEGFTKAAATVAASKPLPSPDAAGCPALDAGTVSTLQNQLKQNANGGPALNNFLALNGLAIAVAVDKDLVTAGGPIMGVYASTHKAQ